ncbi:uncharacterized protein si:dkeyp-55f12.3 [Cyclopterus lumpus]|uniref:uncharacterized protein si:dkeyp-55f12.3 n=1 Tax=Cyclopterus lumpus TaxID=8103 RepID=UPI001486866A|nr:uncharacterized protein si:dkeyp-55f12.3 [Cyclopterus lumpus]
MATEAVVAELRFRDGLRKKITVKVENNLSSLISGVQELNTNVSRLLSELVELESTCGQGEACGTGEKDDSDEGDDAPQSSDIQPPAKRSKC